MGQNLFNETHGRSSTYSPSSRPDRSRKAEAPGLRDGSENRWACRSPWAMVRHLIERFGGHQHAPQRLYRQVDACEFRHLRRPRACRIHQRARRNGPLRRSTPCIPCASIRCRSPPFRAAIRTPRSMAFSMKPVMTLCGSTKPSVEQKLPPIRSSERISGAIRRTRPRPADCDGLETHLHLALP